MAEVRTDVVVVRAAEEVFAYVAEPANAPEWRAEVLAVERVNGTPGVPGAEHVEHLLVAGREVRATLVLEVVEPGTAVEYRVVDPVQARASYRVTTRSEGSAVEFAAWFELHGIPGFLAGVIARAVKRVADEDLARLKGLLEQEPRPG